MPIWEKREYCCMYVCFFLSGVWRSPARVRPNAARCTLARIYTYIQCIRRSISTSSHQRTNPTKHPHRLTSRHALSPPSLPSEHHFRGENTAVSNGGKKNQKLPFPPRRQT